MPFHEKTAVPSPTGAMLNLRFRRADGEPVGVLHVNHGVCEHSGRYGRFADALAGAGFHVYAHDHRGHGETKAQDAPLGRFAATGGVAKVMDDIGCVHDRIARDHPGLPLIMFGHSMGGIAALNFVLRRSERCVPGAIEGAGRGSGCRFLRSASCEDPNSRRDDHRYPDTIQYL